MENKRRAFTSKSIILTVISLSMCLVGCSANTLPTEEKSSQLETEKTSIVDTSIAISTTETTEEIALSETIITTETTEHNPIHIVPQIKIDETLPDGEYFAGILEFDDDCSGATFVVNGYYALPWEEVEGFENGDTVIWGEQESTVSITSTDSENTYFQFDDFSFFQKQSNGYYYLRGDCDYIPFYRIADNYHLNFDPNVVVYDYVYILDFYHYSTDSSYSIENILNNAFQYDTLEHLRSDMEIVKEQNYHYLAGEEYWVGIHIIIENGYVTEMYLNPAQHQNWIPPELISELRPIEEE